MFYCMLTGGISKIVLKNALLDSQRIEPTGHLPLFAYPGLFPPPLGITSPFLWEANHPPCYQKIICKKHRSSCYWDFLSCPGSWFSWMISSNFVNYIISFQWITLVRQAATYGCTRYPLYNHMQRPCSQAWFLLFSVRDPNWLTVLPMC